MSSNTLSDFDQLLLDLNDLFHNNELLQTVISAILPEDEYYNDCIMFVANIIFLLSYENQGPLPLPASKSAIESLQIVISAPKDEDCSICLSEYDGGKEVKEMECKHMFHKECIEKWLGVSSTCPVCRYQMPVDAASCQIDLSLIN